MEAVDRDQGGMSRMRGVVRLLRNRSNWSATLKEVQMKYMAIIYGNKALWESFSGEQAAEAIAAQDAFNKRYAQSGELLAAYGLGDELTAKTVRVRDGSLAVTDGPYIEAKEFVSSFCLLDCESEERALQLASEMPFASHNAVEVWPVLHEAGLEM
jgi:hypothetical protein